MKRPILVESASAFLDAKIKELGDWFSSACRTSSGVGSKRACQKQQIARDRSDLSERIQQMRLPGDCAG